MEIYNNNTLIVVGYRGLGKRSAVPFLEAAGYRTYNIDAKRWDESVDVRVYAKAIRGLVRSGEYDVILLPSFDVVRRALSLMHLNYTLIYPHPSLKPEYMEDRYKRWDAEIKALEATDDPHVNKITIVRKLIYLFDIVSGILENTKRK